MIPMPIVLHPMVVKQLLGSVLQLLVVVVARLLLEMGAAEPRVRALFARRANAARSQDTAEQLPSTAQRRVANLVSETVVMLSVLSAVLSSALRETWC